MKTITATEFKAKCLDILDQVPSEGIAITKRGKEVATLYPRKRGGIERFFGAIPDLVIDKGDDLLSTGVEWNAQS